MRSVPYGNIAGKKVTAYILKNDILEVTLLDYGATIASIRVNGTEAVLGYEPFDGSDPRPHHLGTTIGRCANRIAGGMFTLGGKTYVLEKNSGNNCNHGGRDGFDNRIFAATPEPDAVTFTLVSPDGDSGFPGRLELKVRYELKGNALDIKYSATSDADTLWNPTNHSYFTLGNRTGNIGNVLLRIYADSYTPLNADSVPTGEVVGVKGTPFDFTSPKPIGMDIDADDAQLAIAGGYDHNFIVGEHVATATEPDTGITLDVYSDLPGVQLYTSNFLKDLTRGDRVYGRRSAFCLEPQFFPNAINTDGFEKPILKAGETANHHIRFAFYMRRI